MVRFRLERGPVPLHHQVYVDLRAALAADEWRPGDQLPTERELAERYGCSLITVRRALDELTREGRLERTRGRGTFVTELPIVRDIAGQVGFADEVRLLGYVPYTVVATTRSEAASPVVAAALGIPAGSLIHYIERVRGADNVPLLLEQVRLPAGRLPGLLDHDYGVESLWDVLENDFHLPARLLGLRTRRPSIQLEGTAFTTGGEPIEYSRTVVSPERARYFVESTGSRIRAITPLDLPPRSAVPA